VEADREGGQGQGRRVLLPALARRPRLPQRCAVVTDWSSVLLTHRGLQYRFCAAAMLYDRRKGHRLSELTRIARHQPSTGSSAL